MRDGGKEEYKHLALRFVIVMGIVSLFADITYEGARSIIGPYLLILGATATIVGVVAGLGELLGYSLRLLTGYLSDITKRYWVITIIGYSISLIAIPLLTFANTWGIASMLIIAERLGKAIRTPARDTILAYTTSSIGRGWGFGIHEAMDQIGAIIGPLLVALMLYINNLSYARAFSILFIPALVSLSMLFFARMLYHGIYKHERIDAIDNSIDNYSKSNGRGNALPYVFWLYIAFASISMIGYAHFQLISYHFKSTPIMQDTQIPMIFALAMGIDALAALVSGHLFDRLGFIVLAMIPILSIPIAPLVFSFNYNLALIGIILWGAVMGIQETVMRASVAEITHASRRGSAYGIFNSAYGLSWFIGSVIMGILYDKSLADTIFFSIALEVASLPLLLIVIKSVKNRRDIEDDRRDITA